MRKKLFAEVPNNYLVDDFPISMNVLKSKAKCIHERKAIVFEDVSNHLSAEFKRKVRISAGNFQNLVHFKSMLFRLNPSPRELIFCISTELRSAFGFSVPANWIKSSAVSSSLSS